MKQIKVNLLHISPLHIASKAIRKCHANEHLSDTIDSTIGTKDRNLIHRVGLKHDHSSTLEHITASFDITGISVAVLGQLTRHRLASYTVQSTRYTTDKLLKNEEPFIDDNNCFVSTEDAEKRGSKYVVLTGNWLVDSVSIHSIESVRWLATKNIPNDELRYALPQAWRTNLTMTINFRSLRNFLQLRTSSHAMEEIRHLANLIYQSIPGKYHYLLEDCVVESNTDL